MIGQIILNDFERSRLIRNDYDRLLANLKTVLKRFLFPFYKNISISGPIKSKPHQNGTLELYLEL